MKKSSIFLLAAIGIYGCNINAVFSEEQSQMTSKHNLANRFTSSRPLRPSVFISPAQLNKYISDMCNYSATCTK